MNRPRNSSPATPAQTFGLSPLIERGEPHDRQRSLSLRRDNGALHRLHHQLDPFAGTAKLANFGRAFDFLETQSVESLSPFDFFDADFAVYRKA